MLSFLISATVFIINLINGYILDNIQVTDIKQSRVIAKYYLSFKYMKKGGLRNLVNWLFKNLPNLEITKLNYT